MLSIFCSEHSKMEMRAGCVPRVSRISKQIACGDRLANFHHVRAFFKVDIVAQGAIRVLNQYIIGVPIIFFIRSAAVRIIFGSHNHTPSSSADGCSHRHFPVDGKLVRPSVAISAIKTLAYRKTRPAVIGQPVNVLVVVGDVHGTPSRIICVRPTRFLFWFDRRGAEGFMSSARRQSKSARQVTIRTKIIELHLHGHSDWGCLQILNHKMGQIVFFLGSNFDESFTTGAFFSKKGTIKKELGKHQQEDSIGPAAKN